MRRSNSGLIAALVVVPILAEASGVVSVAPLEPLIGIKRVDSDEPTDDLAERLRETLEYAARRILEEEHLTYVPCGARLPFDAGRAGVLDAIGRASVTARTCGASAVLLVRLDGTVRAGDAPAGESSGSYRRARIGWLCNDVPRGCFFSRGPCGSGIPSAPQRSGHAITSEREPYEHAMLTIALVDSSGDLRWSREVIGDGLSPYAVEQLFRGAWPAN